MATQSCSKDEFLRSDLDCTRPFHVPTPNHFVRVLTFYNVHKRLNHFWRFGAICCMIKVVQGLRYHCCHLKWSIKLRVSLEIDSCPGPCDHRFYYTACISQASAALHAYHFTGIYLSDVFITSSVIQIGDSTTEWSEEHICSH